MNFEYKEVYDYVFALIHFASVCENRIYKTEEVSLCEDVNSIINGFVNDSSQFLISETAYFSKLGISTWLMNAVVCDDNTIRTVSECMLSFERLTSEELYNYIGGLALASFSFESDPKWNQIMHSIPKMTKYIEETKVISESEKVEVLELYKYPEETRQRLTYIYKAFTKLYTSKQKYIMEISKAAIKTYESIYEIDKMEFTKTYLNNIKIDSFKKINVNVSFLQDSGQKSMNSLINKSEVLWISIGINGLSSEKNIIKEESSESFLKALGDPTRLRIMSLIACNPNYVQAIASELKLAPSTIYHHLDNLSSLSLVKTERVGKKVYYRVHREKVLEGIRNLSSILIGGKYEL